MDKKDKVPAMIDEGETAMTWEDFGVILLLLFLGMCFVFVFWMGRWTAPTSDESNDCTRVIYYNIPN